MVTRRTVAQAIDELERFPDALQRRTRGLTWMLWGLVLPGIYLTYSYAGSTMLSGASFSPVWFFVLWIPWVGLGILATAALWRSAGLLNGTARPVWNGTKAFLLFIAVVVALYLAYHFLELYRFVALVGPSVMLLLVGVGTATLGFNNWACPDRIERLLWLVGGIALIATVVIGTLVAGPVAHDEMDPAAFTPALRAFSIIAPVATALVYFGNGLYLSLRG